MNRFYRATLITMLIGASAFNNAYAQDQDNSASMKEPIIQKIDKPIKDETPPLDQIDGLCSIRKFTESALGGSLTKTITYYDYLLLDGTKFASETELRDKSGKKLRDLRPWSQRSTKNKWLSRTWNYGAVPAGQLATPFVVGFFR